MLLREGLTRLLAEAGFDVVGKASNAPELLRSVRLTSPAVAIVDIKMPPTHTREGLVAAQEIREQHPDIAEALFLSTKTIATHIRQIFFKLDIAESPESHRRVLAVLAFLQG
jgi:DNA-binding NarL/FixJ family response regulator